jgi:hypothetical protein
MKTPSKDGIFRKRWILYRGQFIHMLVGENVCAVCARVKSPSLQKAPPHRLYFV